jgi:hypothetical protein
LDCYLGFAHLIAAVAVDRLFFWFVFSAMSLFVAFSVFEMRILLMIWKARRADTFNQGWNAQRDEMSKLFVRFYGAMSVGIAVIYLARDAWILLPFFSFFAPQVISDAIRDTRHALTKRYIVCSASCRVVFLSLFLLLIDIFAPQVISDEIRDTH